MKDNYCFVLCMFACMSVCAMKTAEGADDQGLSLAISAKIPESMHMKHTPYGYAQTLKIRHDIDAVVRQHELEYTWYWLEKLLNPEILSEAKKGNAQAVSGLRPYGDDGILIKWKAKGYTLEVLDSRALTLVIQQKELGRQNIEEVFSLLINYVPYTDGHRGRVISTVAGEPIATVSCGKISVTGRYLTGWFQHPIEWYRDGDALLLIFDKVLETPISKVKLEGKNITKYIGGTRWSDERSFLRFENSNREQLAAEYFRSMNQTDKSMHGTNMNKTIKGQSIQPK